MTKMKIFLVIFSLLSFGDCKKCAVGDSEVEVPDDFNCDAFTPIKRHQKFGSDQNIQPFFWDGFPFPPNSGFPPRFPGVRFPSHWIRRNRRPRPRPPASDIEQCPATGVKFISHPTNCEKYILCVDGEEVAALECPNNFHFSRKLRSCVHPFEAECEDFDFECDSEDTSVQFIPDVTDCNSYYMCIGGNQISLQCGAGLHWNFIENQCMQPNEANCPFEEAEEKAVPSSARNLPPKFLPPLGENEIVPRNRCPSTGVDQIPVPGNCGEFIICFNGQEFPRECPPNLHFCQDLRTCVAPEDANCPDGCPATGIAFLPHEDDCNLYYICFNGISHLLRCPGDTHWSVESEECLDPLEAGCKDFNAPNECPATGIEQIPYPANCEKYILCVNGMEIPLACGPNLHFSPTLRICTVPELAECEEVSKGCPEEDDPMNIVFLPNEENCNLYYLCWGGNQIPMSCPQGLHWSARENACMEPNEANCKVEAFECPEEGVENFPNPDSCSKFFLCVNGQKLHRECPADLHFSPYTRSCILPDLAGCEGWECPETGITFIPDPEDCSSYFFCFNGQEIPMRCGANMHWSILDQTCLPAQDANCPFIEENGEEPKIIEEKCPKTGIKAIPKPNSCHQYILCINGADVIRDCPPSTEFSLETRTCVHPLVSKCPTNISTTALAETCPKINSNLDVVFRSNAEDCEAYFLCLPNEEISMRCGKGFHWNASKKMCMTKDQAHCEK